MRVAQSPNPNVQDGVYIVVGVEDNGKGLTEEDLQKLFARFSQANPRSDQVRYPSSSGLGLYISKKLVELHSGTFSLLVQCRFVNSWLTQSLVLRFHRSRVESRSRFDLLFRNSRPTSRTRRFHGYGCRAYLLSPDGLRC